MTIGSFRLNTLAAATQAAVSYVSATGGSVNPVYSYDTSNSTYYKLHQFGTTGTSNFVVSAGGTVDAIIVGGGGGGGGTNVVAPGAGGGAGKYTVLTGTSVTAQTYSIVVGTGGTGGTSIGSKGGDGVASSAFGTSSAGGVGGTGGSVGTFTGGASGNGTSGGSGTTTGSGGGGGQNSNGSNGTTNTGGNGGTAITGVTFLGTSLPSSVQTSFAGGGGGAGVSSQGLGGGTNQAVNQGGGASGSVGGTGIGGSANTGGGGGGVTNSGSVATGGGGGSGFVAVRYPIDSSNLNYTFVTSATATTSAMTIPATAAIGDICILWDCAISSSSTTPTSVIPTGFTSITASSSGVTNGLLSRIMYKILVSGDPGSTITGMSGTLSVRKIMAIYRPNSVNPPLFPSSGNLFVTNVTQATESAPNNQTLNLSTYYGPIIGIAVWGSQNAVTARGTTVSATRELTAGTNAYMQLWEGNSIQGTTFASNTLSMADYGVNVLSSTIFRMVYNQ